MERTETRGRTFTLYEYTEKEFRDLLGIEEQDPLLSIERHRRKNTIIVRLVSE